MYNSIDIGNKIYFARMRKGLKQSAVCQVLGIGQSAFSDIETGKRKITLEEAFILASALDVTFSWLSGIDVDNEFTYEEQLKIEEYKQYIKKMRSE